MIPHLIYYIDHEKELLEKLHEMTTNLEQNDDIKHYSKVEK